MVQRVATKDNEWQQVEISAIFSFLWIMRGTYHPKENSLELEEDLEEGLLD